MAWEDIAGANSSSYTTPVLGLDDDLSNYRLKITDGVGNVYYSGEAHAILRETNIYYAIEIATGTSVTDTDYGIVDGTIRFITSRPGYDGVGPGYPLWEDDTQNTYAWYEGWLLKDGLSKASRQVDISQTGDYASLSGFSFKVRNMPLFWKFLEDNDIFLTNKQMKYYVVINKKFYNSWQGVIDVTPYGETDFNIKCKDEFSKIHKPIPKLPITETEYVDVSDAGNSKVVPVAFGDVPYSKLHYISPQQKWVKLDTLVDGRGMYCTNSKKYLVDVFDSTWEIFLWTPGKDLINYNQFKNMYLFVRNGGMDEKIGTLILSSSGRYGDLGYSENYIIVRLAAPLEGVTQDEFNASNNVPVYGGDKASARTSDTWYFSIAELKAYIVLSDSEVGNIKTDEEGFPILYTYKDGANGYINIRSIISSFDLTSNNELGKPYIQIVTPYIDTGGKIYVNYPILPTKKYTTGFYDSKFSAITGSLNSLYDKNRTTSIRFRQPDPKAKRYELGGTYDIRESLALDKNIEELYFCVDFTIFCEFKTHIGIKLEVLDCHGFFVDGLTQEAFIVDEPVPIGTWSRNMLPNDYYTALGGNHNDEDYAFERSLSAGKISDDIKNFLLSEAGGRLKCTIFIETGTSSKILCDITIKQIGFVALTTVDFNSDGLYTSLSGETIDGLSTNSVYKTFKKILEDYDGISTSDIDYGNLPDVRDNWHVGRQITERKKSFDYLKELCQQSFTCIYPGRDGKRKLTAWRDDTTTPIAFNQNTIVRDSITKLEVSSLSKVYNDFYLKYHWDPGRNDFGRAVYVTKCWESSFPDEGDLDENGNRLWKTFVGGMPANAYIEAKDMWEACSDSYIRISSINTTDSNKTLSSLYWYVDTNFDNLGDTAGTGANSSAYRFLIECCEWLTRTKQIVTFSIPITETTLQYELLSPATFSDPIYTNSVDRSGWITSIDIDPEKGLIEIELTLDPREIANIGEGVIEEVGIYATDDTIEESGSQPDTITETGV